MATPQRFVLPRPESSFTTSFAPAPSTDGVATADDPASSAPDPRPGQAPVALRLFVIALAECTLFAYGLLVVLHVRPSLFTALHDKVPALAARPTNPKAPSKSANHSTAPKLTSSSGALAISSLVPTSGSAGEHVTIVGQKLVGPGGYVVATFGGKVTPTSCTDETSCSALVPPPPPGTKQIAVRIRTDNGESNVLIFHYR